MFQMYRYSFSKPVTFAIHIPMLAMNIFVVGALIWDIMPSTQSKIFTSHSANVPIVVSVVTNSIATIYGLTLIFLALFNIVIPAFPRIIINCAILFPCYIISIVIFLLRNDWSGLKQIATGQVGIASRTPIPSSPSAPFPDPSSHTSTISARDFSDYAGVAGFAAFSAVASKPHTIAARDFPNLAGAASFSGALISTVVVKKKVPRQLSGFAAFETIPFTRPPTHAGFSSLAVLDKLPRAEPVSSGDVPELTCTDPSWTTEMCAQRWKTVIVIQTVAFVFVWLCFLLVLCEVVLAVMIYQRRRNARLMGKNPDEESDDSESVQGLTVTQVRERWDTAIGRT